MTSQNHSAAGAPIITVSGVSYTYPKAPGPAVQEVSFAVEEGEIFGLLGPSGAGKSTLQNILTRQIRPVATGEVTVLGRDINSWDQRLYEQVGVGFELPNHYLRLTARENLAFFASLYGGKTRDLMELLALVGLAEAADKRVSEFSKGMQVRLNFVRALLHDPPLLFLDEPMTGLDPTTAGRLKDAIKALRAGGKTIILTTHNMHDADELCDRVGFIAAGKLTTLDAPRRLKERYGTRELEVEAMDGTKACFALDGLADNDDFLTFTRSHQIRAMHSQEATLDKVFKIVTGVDLDGGAL